MSGSCVASSGTRPLSGSPLVYHRADRRSSVLVDNDDAAQIDATDQVVGNRHREAKVITASLRVSIGVYLTAAPQPGTRTTKKLPGLPRLAMNRSYRAY